MSDIRYTNLEDLYDIFAVESPAHVASARISLGLSNLPQALLDKILVQRPQWESWSPAEIRLRRAFDSLLSFYGLLEIASLIDYVPDPLPDLLSSEIAERLQNIALRRYYEEDSPFLLPRLLRERIAGEWTLKQAAVDQQTIILFQSFLSLEGRVRRDGAMEAFCRTLDSSEATGSPFNNLIDIVSNQQEFLSRVSQQSNASSSLDLEVPGFQHFIDFCDQLDQLLQQSQSWPYLQSSMWHHYERYFGRMVERDRLGIVKATGCFLGWRPDIGEKDEQQQGADELRLFVNTVIESLERLTAGSYAKVLKDAHRRNLQQLSIGRLEPPVPRSSLAYPGLRHEGRIRDGGPKGESRPAPKILIIGLGGTGFEALVQVKNLWHECEAKIPPHCRLLYLDAVAPKDYGDASLRDLEWAPLVLRDPTAMLKDPSSSYIREWFPEGMAAQALVHGAAAIRPLGRLALHAQPERVVAQLADTINALADRARVREAGDGPSIDEESIEVYVITSLGGATGSGIFLDVAWLVREQLRDVPNVRFIGVFLLPGPFRGLPGTDLVTANAYAALKELDYLAAPRAEVDFTFGPNRKFMLDRSPFDLVYLVDSLSERSGTTEGVPSLARQMAYLPFLMSTSSIGQQIRGVLLNLIPQLEAKNTVHGKRATYASFGVATLELPKSRVLKARQDFEIELLEQLLADKESVQPLGDLGLGEGLARWVVEHFPEHLEMRLVEVDFANPREPIDKLEEIYAATLSQVEEYARNVVEPVARELRQTGAAAMRNLILDVSQKPGRISSAVGECSRLQAVLNEQLHSICKSKPLSEKAEKECKQAWESCRDAFKSRWRRKREGAANEWKDVVNSLVLPDRLVNTIDALAADTIRFLIDRVREAELWCLSAKTNLDQLLKRLIDENVPKEPEPNRFTRYVDPVKIRPRADAGKFLAYTANVSSLLTSPVSDIRAAMNAFREKELDPAFLPGHESSATGIVMNDLHEYIPELRRLSAPLWSYSPDEIPPEDQRGIHHLEMLGIDKRSGDVGAVESQYPTIDVVETGWSERVVHLQIRAGIPLFALTCMDRLWHDYGLRGSGRQLCHIDRRWAGWPEPLKHAFDPGVLEALAQGLVSKQITRSERTLRYRGNLSIRLLGDTFEQAYQTLKGDKEMCVAISRGTDMTGLNGAAQQTSQELWALLLNDGVSLDDRPLVEAVLQCIERMFKIAVH